MLYFVKVIRKAYIFPLRFQQYLPTMDPISVSGLTLWVASLALDVFDRSIKREFRQSTTTTMVN